MQTVGLVGSTHCPTLSFLCPVFAMSWGFPLLPGCLHTLATQPASFFILSHFLPLRLHKSPSLWVISGRWGERMGEDHP